MPRKRSGSKASGKKLYFGIDRKPKGTVYAKPKQALANKQVRRYGKLEVPHRLMAEYLKKHGLPPADYKSKRGGSKRGGSKQGGSKRKVSQSGKKKYNDFIASKTRGGKMTLAEAAAEWSSKKKNKK